MKIVKYFILLFVFSLFHFIIVPYPPSIAIDYPIIMHNCFAFEHTNVKFCHIASLLCLCLYYYFTCSPSSYAWAVEMWKWLFLWLWAFITTSTVWIFHYNIRQKILFRNRKDRHMLLFSYYHFRKWKIISGIVWENTENISHTIDWKNYIHPRAYTNLQINKIFYCFKCVICKIFLLLFILNGYCNNFLLLIIDVRLCNVNV